MTARWCGAFRQSIGQTCRALALGWLIAMMPGAALALSEIPREEMPQPEEDGTIERAPLPPPSGTVEPVPFPDPVVPPRDPDGSAPPESFDLDVDLPDILYGDEALPEPVRRMRELIREACLTGDLEALRPLLGIEPNGTQLSLQGYEGDPIDFLRQISGDGEGQEILAILYEVLDAGYAHIDEGTDEELYVWPYFFAVPLESLDARQRVELFMLVTAGDYEDMKAYGAYIFYRVGITPDGRWQFFVAGD
jgi:hypothetical protein